MQGLFLGPGVSWAFSLTVTEPGKDFEAGYLPG